MPIQAGINQWLIEEVKRRFDFDPAAVEEEWRRLFESEAGRESRTVSGAMKTAWEGGEKLRLAEDAEVFPLRGAAGRIAENMAASLAVPTATSFRVIPIKVADENRRIINLHRGVQQAPKVSFTHLIAWAVVKALKAYPVLNSAFAMHDGAPVRIQRHKINLGVAVDVPGKEGSRSLLVPNLKDAGKMNFRQFLSAYDDLIARARGGHLTPEDFQDTTVTLTNPGTVGTVGSVARLMAGQGAIIATGAIDYPAEYRGTSPEVIAQLGIGKVMTVSCTYDHRIIQGAESGMFLGKVEALLKGDEGFYEEIFEDLKLPHRPVRWEPDRPTLLGGLSERHNEIAKEAAVLQLINAYRVRGHLIADLNPLGTEPRYHPELDPATYGLTIWDLDREFLTGSLGEALGVDGPQPVATLRQILETLRQTYCGKIGCEYMHIQHPEQKRWLQQRMEPLANNWPLPKQKRVWALERLIRAEEFEHFLHTRFLGQKRFSLEGGETAIVILEEILERAADDGVVEVVIGMAHRGRINVLANVIGKPLEQVFSEFEGDPDPASAQGSGDVKYHLGASGKYRTSSGREVSVLVAPNPSHLEAVDPVVEGMVRPKQDRLGDVERRRVIPVLVHGDAAFAGQGVVAETLNLSQLEGYRTGGTIHVIINNQIGFTTPPEEARSSPYSTDVARMVQAPIFHVNGDDPEAAIRAVQVAFDYRQRFGKDVVIDMFCYRRHGHNEADDPSFTQPLLYRKIDQHPSVAALYGERLTREGLASTEQIEELRRKERERLEAAFRTAQEQKRAYVVEDLAPVVEVPSGPFCARTAVDVGLLARVVEGLTRVPEGFRLHPKLRPLLERRWKTFEDGGPIDWAFAEALAFGSLVLEGVPVRLSGQDSARGTFSQRHFELFDYETGECYVPLRHLDPKQARFDVYDSSLSEYAVLGFEFGYSLGDPYALVIWEAQFGDFANGAQIMIDQFITCSEDKWGQPSGLVMLLPHGYEGQGPEHSSARIERFLTLAAGNNIQLANSTTPAQYFHLLRRQMLGGKGQRGIRKPLIVFTPKSLLRHAKAVSRVEELTRGGFQEVLDDPSAQPGEVRRLLLCSGKIYYELLEGRQERGRKDVAIVRVEQLYPFPADQIAEVLDRYRRVEELVWVQEEPKNMGAWLFMRDRLFPLLEERGLTLVYAGRTESASPATGSYKRHLAEQAALIEDAFARPVPRRKLVEMVPKRKAI